MYLVSRAFEENPRPARILGMADHNRNLGARLPNLAIHVSAGEVAGRKPTKSRTHGDFDNDPATMNRVLRRIINKSPATPFTRKSLTY